MGITNTTQLLEDIDSARYKVIDIASAFTTASPEVRSAAETVSTKILDGLTTFEVMGGKLSPESLYKPLSSELESSEKPSELLKIHSLINEYEQRLTNALNYFDDEIAKETEMTLFQRIVFEFDYIGSLSDNFYDANTALQVALFSQNTKTFCREQIGALKEVLDLMKGDIKMFDTTLEKIWDILRKHFSLAGPLAETSCEKESSAMISGISGAGVTYTIVSGNVSGAGTAGIPGHTVTASCDMASCTEESRTKETSNKVSSIE
jgi:hypothetical protein